MPFPADTPESSFATVWKNGYFETAKNYEPSGGGLPEVEKLILDRITEEIPTQILEIGCGGGFWTQKLAQIAPVITLDLSYVPRRELSGVTHLIVPDKSFDCPGVLDESVDVVFSFGLFCHLSRDAQTEYLRHIRRVLRPGGIGVVMFANWDRHKDLTFDERWVNARSTDLNDPTTWFACNERVAREMIAEAGLDWVSDLAPWFRDTIAEFRKS